MEELEDGQHLWLRSRANDKYYLHANDDGKSVSISRRRHSLNAAWTVHMYYGDGPHLLLHSAAYGRYLAATPKPAPLGHRGFRAEQRDYDQPVLAAIMWQAVEAGSGGGVLLRNIDGRYLRANGRLRRYLRWNTCVSVDHSNYDDDNVSPMMHWIMEPILPRGRPPPIPGPMRTRVPGDLSVIMLGRKPGVWRRIHYVRASAEGVYADDGWSALRFRGRSIYYLRNALASRVGVTDIHGQRRDIILCVRAGLYGRLTPLVVNLPHGHYGETLEIVVMLSGTPAYYELRHPDVAPTKEMLERES